MSTDNRSNGFLPLEPLSHADPTAVGLWDMEGGATVMGPTDLTISGVRDQIVLVRLHRQPLAILHLPIPPGQETPEDLTQAAWAAAGPAIAEHVSACGCLPAPTGPQDLRAPLVGDHGTCRGALPVRPAGAAAVILCTTGGQPEKLRRSLRSLMRLEGEDWEIVVVDNRPSLPAVRALVAELSGRPDAPMRYVAEPRPGLAAARNAGLAATPEAAYVAFTDDDVVADPGWLAWLLGPFAEPAVQAVTGLVLPLSLASEADKRFERYAGFGKGVDRATYDTGEHTARDRFLYPYWGGMFGSGNSMAFRRQGLMAVGGFDPALGAGTPTHGGEDIAAFTDIILAGGRLVYEPRALCWHEHRGDEQALRTQVRNYGIGLTAVLWKYLTTDPRLSLTVARTIPQILGLIRSRQEDREQDRLPADLAELEQRGRLLGPWRYLNSRRRWHRASSGAQSGGAPEQRRRPPTEW